MLLDIEVGGKRAWIEIHVSFPRVHGGEELYGSEVNSCIYHLLEVSGTLCKCFSFSEPQFSSQSHPSHRAALRYVT